MLDLGVGVIAYGHAGEGACTIVDHEGLEYPSLELPIDENAVVDGAVLGETRLAGRRFVLVLDFDETYTRAQVAALWRPGTTYTLTGTVSGVELPYKVQRLAFLNPNLAAPMTRVSLIGVSELACPEGDTLTATFEGGTGSGWGATEALVTHAATDGYDQLTFLGAGVYEVGKGTKFILDAAQRVQGVKLYIASATPRDEWLCEVRLHTNAVGYPGGTVLATGQALISTTSELQEFTFMLDTPVELGSGYEATIHVYSLDAITWWNELRFATDSAKGYTDGGAYTVTSDGVDLGYVLDTTADLKFVVIGQNLDTGTGEVTFDADTDVPCAPVITCVIVTGDDELVLTGSDWTTTITGPFVTGDIIVVDARNYTVTVNGVDAIADFVRTGDWPEVSPGSNTITIAPAAATTVQWKPRRLGLI